MGRPVTHWQVLAKDPARLAGFYARLFEWGVSADNPLGYATVDTRSPRGIAGGFWPAGPEGCAFVQLFVEVDDVRAYVERATALGASVVVPPQALPAGGELAIVRDPEGLTFGLTSAQAAPVSSA